VPPYRPGVAPEYAVIVGVEPDEASDPAANTGAVGAGPAPDAGPSVTGVSTGIVELGDGLATDAENGSGPTALAGCKKISPPEVPVPPATLFLPPPELSATAPPINASNATSATANTQLRRDALGGPNGGGPDGGPAGGPGGGPDGGPDGNPDGGPVGAGEALLSVLAI
jgi:hypothetical protein